MTLNEVVRLREVVRVRKVFRVKVRGVMTMRPVVMILILG